MTGQGPQPPGALIRWREEIAVDPELATVWTPLREAAAWEQSGLEAQRERFSADAVASDFRRAREIMAALSIPIGTSVRHSAKRNPAGATRRPAFTFRRGAA